MAAIWNQNTDLINGDNLLLYLTSANTVVAYATSVSLQVDSESIDTSSKFSCRWQQNMNGKSSYSISCDALYCNNASGLSFDQLLSMQIDGTQVDWVIGEEADFQGDCESNPHTLDKTKPYYTGKAVVTSVSLSAGSNEMASCSATLTGAGEIQKKTS